MGGKSRQIEANAANSSLRQRSQNGNEALSRDQIFEVLSNERRRKVLHYINQLNDRERISLRELVDHVAAWENDTTIDELRSEDRKSVYTALRQSHLPKLQREGLIEFNQQRSEVILQDRAEEIEVYLEYVPGHEIRWSHTYLTLSVLSAVLILVSWQGIRPFNGISDVVLATLIVGMFIVTSIAHLYMKRKHRVDHSYDLNPSRTS